jgi:threonine synthase
VNAYTGRLVCVRCGTESDDLAPWAGCPACAAAGWSANLLPRYDLGDRSDLTEDPGEPGIFRWRDLLPVPDDAAPVSLAEGNTPLLAAPALADELGVGELLFKDETRNPTWSYKDRLAAVAITVARARGAHTVALATSGNHGAATAAYAAAAGLRCVVLTMASVPRSMKTLMQSYGATVVAFRTAPERWKVLSEAVAQWGWTPLSGFRNPPLGSNPFGVDGYKTIAYEIIRDLPEPPTAVVVPAAYGDGLAGIQRGFADLLALGVIDRLPRMIAVDPFGAYRAALAEQPAAPVAVAAPGTVAFSIGTPIATFQGLRALQHSAGTAAAVPDDADILAAQQHLASTIGLYAEPTSAICLPGLRALADQGQVGSSDRVVCVATSSGLKDVDATAARLPAVPVIDSELSALKAVLDGASS